MRVEAEPRRDLLARRPRALGEQLAQHRAGLGAPPPVLADLARSGGRAAGRRGSRRAGSRRSRSRRPCRRGTRPSGSARRRPRSAAPSSPPEVPPSSAKRRPEVELELELRDVAAEQQRLEEDRRLGVLGRLLVGEAEVLGVPFGLARDRLEDVRVDLGQRVVAREAAERVRQRGVAVAVVERVAGLVQERLVVVEPALRARDQVDDLAAGRRRSRTRAATSAAGRRGRA